MILTNSHRRNLALLDLIAASLINAVNFAQPQAVKGTVGVVLALATCGALVVQFRELRGPRRD